MGKRSLRGAVSVGLAGLCVCLLGSSVGCGSGTSSTGSGPVPVPGLPQLGLSASALSFGTVAVGSLSAAQTVMLTNGGTAALTLGGIAATGDFTETNGCGAGLAVGTSCQVSVVFAPAAAGARAGTLTVSSNAAGGSATVALSGTGVTAGAYAGPAFTVQVRAGTGAGAVPVRGAQVQLYAAGSGGNGSAATGLLSGALITDATGNASVAAGYRCPTANSLLYLVATGGTVGTAGAANGNVALMSGAGPCNGAGGVVTLNEATTVAAAYALAPFYAMASAVGSAGSSIGASATNGVGLRNAFATSYGLADPLSGFIGGVALPANVSLPTTRMASVANALNTCVVSSGACAALYAAAGSGASGDTLDAAFAVARSPGSNVAALYGAARASSAYGPGLTAVPADWTMYVVISGGGLNSPSGMGVDSGGNVWVANYFGVLSKFSTTGAAVFAGGVTGAGLNNSYGLAVDGNDAVWVTNEQPKTAAGTGSVSVLSAAGVSLAGASGYTAGGMNYPISIALDPNGTTWVVEYGDSALSLLNAAGMPLSGASGFTTPNFAFPVAVAVDGNHFGWVVNQASDAVTKVAPDGSSFVNYTCCHLASGIAIDAGNNIWVADYYNDSVSLMTNAGTVVSNSLTGGGSIYHPQGIAVDGAGTVWVANYRAPYLTELAGSGAAVPGAAISPATGLGGDAGQVEAYALALDASGNVWVSNAGSNTVTKFIGLATPVKTPLLGLPRVP